MDMSGDDIDTSWMFEDHGDVGDEEDCDTSWMFNTADSLNTDRPIVERNSSINVKHVGDEEDSDTSWMFTADSLTTDKPIVEHNSSINVKHVGGNLAALKPGAIRKDYQHPELVEVTKDFIKTHGFSAQNRRRSETANSSGVSLTQITTHVKRLIPTIKISRSTVHRLMVPPRKNTRTSRDYKSVVNARVPRKDNSAVASLHQDSHFCASNVAGLAEFSNKFSDAVMFMSLDNLNKTHVGTLAVSRYHQHQRFFMNDDSPIYHDHDFPYSKSKLSTAGYMVIEEKSNTKTVIDKLNRQHYNFPRTGRMYLVTRACRHHAITAATHAEDLAKIVEQEHSRDKKTNKNIICAIVDGGPDYSPKGQLSMLHYGNLWFQSNLDALVLTCYAPSQSAKNPIEHAWAPFSRALTGVTLPIVLPGETCPPMDQTNIDNSEKALKTSQVFDSAIDNLHSYWDHLSYDGFPVLTNRISASHKPPHEFDTEKLYWEYTHASMKKVNESVDLKKVHTFYLFIAKHVIRTNYMLAIRKCTSKKCGYCSRNPIVHGDVMDFLHKRGGLPFFPVPSQQNPGHFVTFTESLTDPVFNNSNCQLDKFCPSLSTDAYCKICNAYVYTSETDRIRHQRFVHSGKVKTA